MQERLTEELLDELLSSPSPNDYLEKHASFNRDLAAYLQQLARERGMEHKDVVKAAQLDATYGYQLFTGQRTNPSRDKLLQLAFALQLGVRETDRLLQAGGASKLYCKNRRDAIVIFCLDRQATLAQTNETLYRMNETVLGG